MAAPTSSSSFGATLRRLGSQERGLGSLYARRTQGASALQSASAPVDDDDDEGEASLPSEWRFAALPWMRASPWLRRAFPCVQERRERLLTSVRTRLVADAPELVRPTVAIVGSVVSSYPRSEGVRLSPLNLRLEEIRQASDSLLLQLVHFLIAALDVGSRFADNNPVLAGVRAAGWTEVPTSLAAVVVELALTLHQGRASVMTGRTGSFELRVSADPKLLEVQLTTLAAAAVAHAGVDPSLGWLRGPGARSATMGGCSLSVGKFHFDVLRVLRPDDPSALALYEAYADLCEPLEAYQVESAVLMSLRRRGEGEGECLLRSAVRAWLTGDVERAAARTEAAFAALSSGDVDARAFAAALAGLLHAGRAPFAARAWWTTAKALDSGESRCFRAGLSEQLEALPSALVGPSAPGETRAGVAEKAALKTLPVDPSISWLRMLRNPEAESPVVDPEFDLGEVRRCIVGEPENSYERFSEEMARLLERRSPAEAAELLAARHRSLEEELRLEARTERASGQMSMAATLASWVCAGLADLYDLLGRSDRWQEYKLRQLQLEDHEGALPELSPEGVATWIGVFEEFEPRARARHCLDEAKEALAAGAGQKAKFWAERARHYSGALQP